MEIKIFCNLVCEFILVETFALAFGSGIGFLQGLCAFNKLHTETKLGLCAWAALTGAGVSLLLVPILYYGLLRGVLTVEMLAEILFISLICGMISAYFLTAFLDAGWLSCLVTPIAAVLVTIFLRKYHMSN